MSPQGTKVPAEMRDWLRGRLALGYKETKGWEGTVTLQVFSVQDKTSLHLPVDI